MYLRQSLRKSSRNIIYLFQQSSKKSQEFILSDKWKMIRILILSFMTKKQFCQINVCINKLINCQTWKMISEFYFYFITKKLFFNPPTNKQAVRIWQIHDVDATVDKGLHAVSLCTRNSGLGHRWQDLQHRSISIPGESFHCVFLRNLCVTLLEIPQKATSVNM